MEQTAVIVPSVNLLSRDIIGAAIEVHRHLGPGLLESAYLRCLRDELGRRGIVFDHEVPVPLRYKDRQLDCGYRLDLLVGGRIIVELKTVEKIMAIHEAQLLSYLRLLRLPLGLLINFRVTRLTTGIRRIVNGL
jgi:GxxExxY protein